MTKKINETKRVFEEKLAEYEQKESYNNKLFKRLSDAKENIVSLEEEKNNYTRNDHYSLLIMKT